ncbi:VOC family protein [Mucilaginibacter terrigena]|uniref:VOC family protein n=1 Tax=Mucilaginibacter terrigena TaxID=2492395 RepID=A0A4Q5LPN0_9SPHI|nr:VOC family protein [Mucilaginibacter terrigena]RYU91259.1 VOC family protein [Mucilaginibacter terrigena]
MRSIELISIPVTDQQVAKEFYLKLGFKIIVEAPYQGGANWIQMGLPEGNTNITLVNWFPEFTPGSIQGFVIKCEDIEASIAALSAEGVEVATPSKTPWGRFATVKDPDGNAWSLHGE